MKRKFFIALVSLLFLISPVLAQSQTDKFQVRINQFDGGMNSFSLADILQPNQGASLVNVELDRPGKLSKRGGQALFMTDQGSTAFTGIGRFDPDATTSYLVTASGIKVLRATVNASDWTIANPSSPQTTGKNTEFVQANDLLFVLNGFDPIAWYDGANWAVSGTYPTSPPTATTGAWVRNYLFLAGATTENDWVYFSNNLAPTLFSASDIVKINTGDGQGIQHLEPYRLNEVIVYKERSIFVLDITGTTVPDDWTVQPISTVIGTIAPRSVVSLGNDQWFLSSEPIAVRSLVRSEFDKILVNMVSAPIQDVFDGSGNLTINTTNIHKAAAVLFDNKYLIAIPTGTSTVNNTVFVYDFLVNSWYRIDGWFPTDWVVFNNQLYYIDAKDGKVVQCFTSNYVDFEEGPTGASVPSVAITFDYETKVLDFDAPENFKELDAMEVEFDPTGDDTAEVFVNLDNGGWQLVGTVSLAGNTQTLSLTLPFTLSNQGVARKTFQLTKFNEFKKMQVKVKQNGASEQTVLQRITIFGRVKPWRRNQ